jgi:thiamine-phosphate pyrophosphorylase
VLESVRLYLVCDEPSDAFLAAVLRGGVQVVQLRMKDAPDEMVLAAAARVRDACHTHGALAILNDRADLAAQAGMDGVHVGQDDMPVARARALVGADRIVGLSTHSPAQITAATGAGADYIGVGPVHATPTKPGRPAVGLELVRHAATHARLPWFAIGGIDPGNVGAVVAAGAERIAVVRALTQSAEPEAAARALRAAAERREVGVGAT